MIDFVQQAGAERVDLEKVDDVVMGVFDLCLGEVEAMGHAVAKDQVAGVEIAMAEGLSHRMAAQAFGALGQRIGPKPAILMGIAVYLAALVYAWQFLTDEGDFYLLAVAIGLVQGGVQSLSRSLYARLVPLGDVARGVIADRVDYDVVQGFHRAAIGARWDATVDETLVVNVFIRQVQSGGV